MAESLASVSRHSDLGSEPATMPAPAQQDPELPVQVGPEPAGGPCVPAPGRGFGLTQPGPGGLARAALGRGGGVEQVRQVQEVQVRPYLGADRCPQVLGIVQAQDPGPVGDLQVPAMGRQGGPQRLNHQGVLMQFLRRRQHGRPQCRIPSSARGPCGGPGDGVHLHATTLLGQQALRGGRHQADTVALYPHRLAGGVEAVQGLYQVLQVEGTGGLDPDPTRQHHLLQATLIDGLQGRIHRKRPVAGAGNPGPAQERDGGAALCRSQPHRAV